MERSISWKIHLQSSRETVYQLISTDVGRAQFWADETVEEAGEVRFSFSNGETVVGEILEKKPNRRLRLTYFDRSEIIFELDDDPDSGTILTLTEPNPGPAVYLENKAGWVTVLLTLKAAADHGVDLRNADPTKSWENGFVDV